MSLTRHLHSPIAGPRRGSASVWTVMLLVLAVVSVQALCTVHLDDLVRSTTHSAGSSTSHAHGVVGQDAVQGITGSQDASARAASEPALDGGSHGCFDRHPMTTQCDPARPLPPSPAVVPDLAVQRLVPGMTRHESRAEPSGTAAAAPSLHAMGISRT
jgi:hypothetical protein